MAHALDVEVCIPLAFGLKVWVWGFEVREFRARALGAEGLQGLGSAIGARRCISLELPVVLLWDANNAAGCGGHFD